MNIKIIQRISIIACFAWGMVLPAAGNWTQVTSTIPGPETAGHEKVIYNGGTVADITYGKLMGFIVDNTSKNAYLTSNLKSLEKNAWKVHYGNLDTTTSIFDGADTSRILLYSGVKEAEIYSQAYSAFTLADSVLAAQKARVSFDLAYMGLADSAGLNIEINGPGWIDGGDIEIEFRGMGPQSNEPSSRFTFGLVNIATGEIFSADISTSAQQHLLNLEGNDWFAFNAGQDGSITVSFELDSSQLSAITDAGLGLFVKSENTGDVEIFSIGNFSVEVLGLVPEPAEAAAVFGLLAACLIFFKRRNARS